MGNNPHNNAMAEEKQFDERMVNIDRVARVVKGGRRFRFRALVVVGDHKGQVGVGTSKGTDVTMAMTKATEVAKKNMVKINLFNDTIPHESQAKVAGAKILVKPASPGTGLIAGGVVRVVLEVAGVKNALSKSLGSSNKINIAYATVEALKLIEPKSKWVPTKQAAKNASTKKVPAAAKKSTATKTEKVAK
jgi:small subunit ribosomal protein S5